MEDPREGPRHRRRRERRCCSVGMGRRVQVVGPKWVWRAGTCGVGEKNNLFLAETLLKLRYLWSFHLFGHHATWWVGPVWGVRQARIGWERFSIVFAPYSIDKAPILIIYQQTISLWFRTYINLESLTDCYESANGNGRCIHAISLKDQVVEHNIIRMLWKEQQWQLCIFVLFSFGITHYRKRGLCRVFKSLSCVFYQAHGKELLCCASSKTQQQIFVVRLILRCMAKNFCRAF
jgi:hypothetical protein